MSEKNCEMRVTVKIGDDEKSVFHQLNMSYKELVVAQAIMHKAFDEAGFAKAALLGQPLTEEEAAYLCQGKSKDKK